MKLLQTIIHHPLTDVLLTGRPAGSSITVVDVKVGRAAEQSSAVDDGTQNIRAVVSMLRSYLDGIPVDFTSVELDLTGYTRFQTTVLEIARNIPYGASMSYSGLARQAGFPGAVRAVASVMRKNRFPLIIPCHRVVRKNGATGAYCGDATGEDARLKRTLLLLEKSQEKTPPEKKVFNWKRVLRK